MKIIVAIDDSPYSEYLVSAIGKRSWPVDTQFKVLSVIEPAEAQLVDELALQAKRELVSRRKHHAEKLTGAIRKKIEAHVPDAIVHCEIRNGDPRREIIAAAAEWEADRILIGARGRSVCPQLSLGSVSREVTRHAHCTVEVVREPSRSQLAEAQS